MMHGDHFEKKFDEFLGAKEFDGWESALFRLIRAAFEAGWNAGREVQEEGKTEETAGKIIPFRTCSTVSLQKNSMDTADC